MNEIKKENDIFVSTLLNGNANANDLMHNGVTADNTGLLSPEEYKKSKFVQQLFSDEKGNFNDELFNQVYLTAAQKYDELTSAKTFDNLEKYITYNADDIYAPLGATKGTPTFELKKFRNPYEVSVGVKSIYGEGDPTKSARELALGNKIYDRETEKWLDYSPEDMNIFKAIFSDPLVYATWDEDGEHYDEQLHRTVQHRKGEWKLDPNGKFYTETLGDREGYGKLFVLVSDILTREDSWMNKIDFFDSDDLHKSIPGTIFKTLATIAPYFLPGGWNVVWGGVVAATNLATVMPTFAKMLEGIALGDEQSNFGRTMNRLENYWAKFGESYSDEALGKIFGFEQMMSMVSDIFGQLYQMNAMASLSKLTSLSTTKAEQLAIKAFNKKHGHLILQLISDGEFKGNPSEFYNKLLAMSPEIKAIADKLSKLAKSLSLGYMALTSSADVFLEALDGGYDRRTAGFAAMAATAGQYAIMMNNRMGDWFLKATTGYTDEINRGLMKKAISPYFNQIQEALSKMSPTMSTEEKSKILANLFNLPMKGLKSWLSLIKDGSEDFWKRAIIEGTEEVTEEAVMDATKGVFDFLTWAGIGKNRDASFGGWENAFSKEGATRYLMNAVGGFLGGALFQVLGKYIEPLIAHQKLPEPVKANLIHEIANGNIDALLKACDDLAKSDNEVFAMPVTINQNEALITSDGLGQTRGLAIAGAVKNYIRELDAIINNNGLKLTDDELIQKVILNEKIISALEKNQVIGITSEGRVNDLIINEFNNLVEDFTKTKLELQSLNPETDEEGVKRLTKLGNEKLKRINEFLSGENAEDYLKKALALTNDNIRQAIGDLTIYDYTKSKYGKLFKDFPKSGQGITQQSIREEYNDYIDSKGNIAKYLDTVLGAFDLLSLKFSPVYKEFAEGRYGDVAKLLFDNVLSDAFLADAVKEGTYKSFLRNAVNSLKKNSKPGATLKDMFLLDSNLVSEQLLKNSLKGHLKYFQEVANINTTEETPITAENITELFKQGVANELESLPVETITTEMVNNALLRTNTLFANLIYQTYKLNGNLDLLLSTYNIKPSENEEDTIKNLIIATSPKIADDIDSLLGGIIMSSYLLSQPAIDADILNRFKKIVKTDLKSKSGLLQGAVQGASNGNVSFPNRFKDVFYLKVDAGLENNKTFEEIVDDFLMNPLDGLLSVYNADDEYYLEGLQENPNMPLDIKKSLIALMSSEAVEVYDQAVKKSILSDPIYDLLKNLSLELSDGTSATVFDIIEKESTYLEGLTSIDDYIRLGVTMEQIKNARKILNLAKGIVESMNAEPESEGTPYGYNSVIANYLLKYRDGKNAENYQTIDPEKAALITRDLDQIDHKLSFIEALSESNVASKASEDRDTKIAFTQVLTDQLLANAGKITAKGLSIIPEEVVDILGNLTLDPNVRLGKAEHLIYEHFRKIANPDNIQEIAHDIVASGNFNIDIESEGMDAHTNKISGYDFLTYLTTILSVDQAEFDYAYKQLLQNHAFDKVAYFAQEFATKVGYSFSKDDLGLHNAIVDQLYKLNPTELIEPTKAFFFLNGISGAGKTSVVAKNLYLMLGQDYDKIGIAGPNVNQAEKLERSVTSNVEEGLRKKAVVMNKEQLMKKVLSEEAYRLIKLETSSLTAEPKLLKLVKGVNTHGQNVELYSIDANNDSLYNSKLKEGDLPKLIFIDEVTHFNSLELKLLNTIADHFGIKILTFGDTLQDSAEVKDTPQHIDQVFRWQAPRLLNSQRPSQIHKRDNVVILTKEQQEIEELINIHGIGLTAERTVVNKLAQHPLELKYYEDDNLLAGDKIVSEISVEDVKRIKRASGDKKIGVLVNLDSDGKIADTPEALKLLNTLKAAGLTETDYELYSPLRFDPKAVQGAEEEFFIINDLNFTGDFLTDFTKFYTFITRSLTGSVVKLDNPGRLYVQNRKCDYTELFVNPSDEQKEMLKEAKIKEINSIIGESYIPKNISQASQPVPEAVVETSNEQKLVEKELKKNPAKKINIQQEPSNENKSKLTTYGFYNHLGIKIDSNHYFGNDRGTRLDLDGLYPTGLIINEKAIVGFIKLKNLLTLYPNTASEEFKQGVKKPEICYFIRSVVTELSNAEDSEVAKWVIDNLEIEDKTYLAGIKMDRSLDIPVKKLGYDVKKTVDNGEPIFFLAKHLRSKDGKIDRYISISTLPLLSTIASWSNPPQIFLDALSLIRDNFKDETNPIYLKELNSNPTPVNAGRIIRANNPDEFTSIADLQAAGMELLDLGLITSHKTNGDYTFINYLKNQFRIDTSWMINGDNLDVSGKYYAVIGYEGSKNSNFKKVLILDTKSDNFDNIIRNIKNAKGREGKGKYLSEYSQTQLVLSTLRKVNAYNNKSVLLNYFTSLRDKLNSETNKDKYTRQIQDLTNFINNYKNDPESLSEQKVKEMLETSTMIGIYFADSYFRNNAGKLKVFNLGKNAWEDVTFGDESGYYNLFPKEQMRDNGSYALDMDTEDYNYLGLRGWYLEMPNFLIDPQSLLESMPVETTTNNPVIEETSEPNNNFILLSEKLSQMGYSLEDLDYSEDAVREISDLIPANQLWDYIMLNDDAEIINQSPNSVIGKQIQNILDRESDNDIICS